MSDGHPLRSDRPESHITAPNARSIGLLRLRPTPMLPQRAAPRFASRSSPAATLHTAIIRHNASPHANAPVTIPLVARRDHSASLDDMHTARMRRGRLATPLAAPSSASATHTMLRGWCAKPRGRALLHCQAPPFAPPSRVESSSARDAPTPHPSHGHHSAASGGGRLRLAPSQPPPCDA